MKRITILFAVAALVLVNTSCERGDLSVNPNAAGPNAIINPDLFVNRLTNELYYGGGVLDNYANAIPEGPWTTTHRYNQYYASSNSYYQGINTYNWTNSSVAFSILKYAVNFEKQTILQGGTNINKNFYLSLAKFFKAYSFIWYTQRVGDIPMTQAGDPNNLTPKYDTQHDVYKNSLALLDTANTLMSTYIAYAAITPGAPSGSAGDIYKFSNLQWQKVINSYKLRVLISLSKKADAADAADLNIKSQFAAIVNNPATYPIMTGNADNMVYKFDGTYSLYPIKLYGETPYSGYASIGKTFLDLTTANQDPRTFLAATPAPNSITALTPPNIDFSSRFNVFVGADNSLPQTTLLSNPNNYSYTNFRYYKSSDGSACESAIVMGYPELCFNIAEGINRGWAAGNDGQWYLNGINASLAFFAAAPNGIVDGSSYQINDLSGSKLGTATISFSTFLSNVAYSGNGSSAGLTQILQQKYVAFWQNSGLEAFYNWRRTGVPAFAEDGPGIGTSNDKIQRRWMYDNNEINGNFANYNTAIQSQYGGTDDVTKNIWALQ